MYYLYNEERGIFGYNEDRESLLKAAYGAFGSEIQDAVILMSIGMVDVRPIMIKNEDLKEEDAEQVETSYIGIRMARGVDGGYYNKATHTELETRKFHVMLGDTKTAACNWMMPVGVHSLHEEKDSVDVFGFQVCKHCLNSWKESFELRDGTVTHGVIKK